MTGLEIGLCWLVGALIVLNLWFLEKVHFLMRTVNTQADNIIKLGQCLLSLNKIVQRIDDKHALASMGKPEDPCQWN